MLNFDIERTAAYYVGVAYQYLAYMEEPPLGKGKAVHQGVADGNTTAIFRRSGVLELRLHHYRKRVIIINQHVFNCFTQAGKGATAKFFFFLGGGLIHKHLNPPTPKI